MYTLDKISSWLRMDRSLFGHNPLPQITPAESRYSDRLSNPFKVL